MSASIFWFVVGLALFIFELFVPAFVLVFFGIGAWLTLLAQALGLLPGVASQTVAFLASSLLALFFLRKKIRRLNQKPERLVAGSNLVGCTGIMLTALGPENNYQGGQVEVHGTVWNADSIEDIAQGARVLVIGQDNLSLLVENYRG